MALSNDQYRLIAEFRYRLRQFLHFSEEVAREHRIEPQQHQLLLAIRGLPKGTRPTITAVSARLCLRHHSTVELVNRLVARGAIARQPCDEDAREVLLALTPQGEQILQQLHVLHWQELQNVGPSLIESLREILDQPPMRSVRQA